MPVYRLILILVGCVAIPTLLTFSTLLQSHPRNDVETDATDDMSETGFRSFFSFHTPSTLFPPSAIISLTDDNSTFFLARPADFGPPLVSNGMSGQLWIGSGFGDSGRGSGDASTEGELGCSDIPGWDDASPQTHREITSQETRHYQPELGTGGKKKRSKSANTMSKDTARSVLEDSEPNEDDGTDDYFHYPLPTSPVTKPSKPGVSAERQQDSKGRATIHGDIQSLQESAEISGKVVLLSRGGCGFLEKVKWVQRRGGIALIVGDHTRGGALVTMYARGDTSNVSIPAVFTSHTTAHLLASLIPTDHLVVENEDSRPDGGGFDGSKKGINRISGNAKESNADKPTFTPPSAPKPTSTIPAKYKVSNANTKKTSTVSKEKSETSWLKSLLGIGRSTKSSGTPTDNTRPPSSGRLDWFTPRRKEMESKESGDRVSAKKDSSKPKSSTKEPWWPGSHANSNDGFEIGVQDWRDPDLLVTRSTTAKGVSTSIVHTSWSTASTLSKPGKDGESEKGSTNLLSGGSITPGSGQYNKPENALEKQSKDHESDFSGDNRKHGKSEDEQRKQDNGRVGADRIQDQVQEEHEGLWVTITPTTMSTSPFFDTLLVLVVSPLVTLTVVYALLLLRSRIRRRRWRAPKSVVERLPIRTYHTMSCSSTASSTRFTSPHNSSANSPHRQPSQRSSNRSRPRSATASGIGEAVSASLEQANSKTSLLEKSRNGHSKRKYNGKQVECVVCLEEYVDGKSKVMSLPCGHEFHAECITPWLTTRRRTCPICKGDVVRSMAHPPTHPPANANTVPSPQAEHLDPSDIQTQIAETTNDSPSAAMPIPCNNDLERGDDMAATLVNDRPEPSSRRTAWSGFANMSLSAFSGEAVWRQAREDRNR